MREHLASGLAWRRWRRAGRVLPVAVLFFVGRPDAVGTNGTGLNLVVITLDTTRADRLGAYASRFVATPQLDWLARTGSLFEQATTAAPLTLPAHCSLFTGRLPPAHGVRENGGFSLPATQPTLAAILHANGYRTGAFPASIIVGRRTGLEQGFELYEDGFLKRGSPALRRPANAVTDRAIDWLEGVRASRFFAWVHFYDAHAPYEPPEPFRTAYAGRAYDGAIAFADEQIGRLVTWLRRRNLLERTVIVVIADHGESLGEHGEWTHALRLYQSVLHVPFIVRAPGVSPGRRITCVVRAVDVMPTALALLGLRSPSGLDGVDLLPLMTGKVRDLDLDAYSETMYPWLRLGLAPGSALRTGRFKLVRQDGIRLYDVVADPNETTNLTLCEPALADRLDRRLSALTRHVPKADNASIDPTVRAELAALGYVNARRP